MKNKLKIKYLSGGPPQNPYFGKQSTGISKSNIEDVSRSVAGSVANLNASQEQKQLEGFKSLGNSAMKMAGMKKGGFRYRFQTGGTCPPGLALDKASGQCLPDPNWVGATPGLGVLAEEYLPGMQAAWEGENQPADFFGELKDTGITKVQDISGSILLKDEYLTDPNTINALQGVGALDEKLTNQAKRAGKVTDLVEQGAPMASNKMNFGKGVPGATTGSKILDC